MESGKRLSGCVLLTYIVIFFHILTSHTGVLAKPANLDRAKSMSAVVSSEGLYSSTDDVVILNVTTFESTVLGTNNAWLVEFYNTWCGHCVRYAPIWKEFAKDVAGWTAAVRIAVVDCVVEANTPLCRDYEIMHYPTVKFFTAQHKKGDFGKEVDKGRDAPAMRQILTGILEKEQVEGRGAHWPNITPYRSSDIHNLWKDVSNAVQYSVLVFKDKSGEVGTDIVLDLSRVPEIQTRTVSHENEALAKLMHVSSFPSVVVVEHGQERGEPLHIQDKSRSGIKIAVQAFLKTKGIQVPEVVGSKKVVNHATGALSSAAGDNLQRLVKQIMSERGDVAFLGDLEHALRYSLRHEVGSRKNMTGSVLQALNNYLRVILFHFPLSSNGQRLLQSMYDQVKSLKELPGEDWKRRLANAEQTLDAPAWTEREDFLGCHGSQPNFRGYPCSLWTTFHVLTVSALNKADSNGPRDVLEAILGYITHFFGCAECSNHFQSMAAETMFSDVNSHEDSVLWLWEAHNKVNNRLAGDATEDPEFPKIQFPSVDRCPGCRDAGAWVKKQVLAYLQSIFSHEALSTVGASGSSDSLLAVPLTSGSEMSTLDMSLYVLLYLASAAIIALVCLRFLYSRSYHKKIYTHGILGRV